jgi:hypothetical protein
MPIGVEGKLIDYEDIANHIVFLYYEDIDEGYDPVYEDQVVRGRSEEHSFYSHTSAESESFAIRLAASVNENDESDAKKIWNDYLFIKSFAYPDYGIGNLGPIKPPRKAIITIGRWLRKVGSIRSPSATFSKVCDEDGYPLIIDVKFQLRVINPSPRSFREVRKIG